MQKTLSKILLAFLFAVFFSSCEDEEVLVIEPLASLKLDVSLGKTKHEFPNSFKAYVEILIIDDDGQSCISTESDSIVFEKQLDGIHSSQNSIEIPIDKNVLINITANVGDYSLLGRSDTIKVSLSDQEIQIVNVYLTTGNIIIDKPSLLSLGSSAAMISSMIIDEGISSVTESGFVWNTNEVTSLDDNIGSYINSSNNISDFKYVIEDLTPGTTYYIAAYAKNTSEIAYSEQLSFSTNESNDNVVLFTNNASSIGPYAATLTSNFVDDGNRTIVEKGFVWATYTNPEISNNEGITFVGDGVESFNSNLTGLLDGTIYYARSYAETLEGDVFYGNEVSFTTILLTVPEDVYGEIDLVLLHTAKINVFIHSDGGLDITSKGVVYSQIANPSIDVNEGMTNDGTGSDDFVSNLSGLTDGVTYYARSYAINDKGVSYGDEFSFVTLKLGDYGPGGGIIFVDGGDSGGMEIGTLNTEVNMQWGCATNATNATSSTFGSGLTNTITIVDFHNSLIDYETNPTQCGGYNDGTIAAKYCYEFSQNGYDDWFLPSHDELYILFSNLDEIGINDFTPDYSYASSTEVDEFNIQALGIEDALNLVGPKEDYYAVRPVRRF